MDRRVGNTKNLGAIFGVLAAIGVPVPVPGSIGFKIAQALNRLRTLLSGEKSPRSGYSGLCSIIYPSLRGAACKSNCSGMCAKCKLHDAVQVSSSEWTGDQMHLEAA